MRESHEKYKLPNDIYDPMMGIINLQYLRSLHMPKIHIGRITAVSTSLNLIE